MSSRPGDLERPDSWLQQLLAPDEVDWIAYDALPSERRAGLAAALRAEAMERVRSQPQVALPLSERLLRATPALPDRRALAERTRAVALHANGRSGEALAHYERALELHRGLGATLEVVRVLRSLVDVHQMCGRSDAALACAEDARALLDDLGTGTSEVQMLRAQLECNVGNVHFRLDRYDEARRFYERAAEIFEEHDNVFGRAHALYNLGNIETNAHRFEPAVRNFEAARSAFEDAGHVVLAADCAYALGYLDLRRGRFTNAVRALNSARAAYTEGGKPSGAPLCDLDLAELHLKLDAYRDAIRHGRKACEGFDALDMGYEAAKARLLLGLALAGLERRQEAEATLSDAAGRLERLGNQTLSALATLHRAAITRSRDRRGSTVGGDLGLVRVAAERLTASGDRELHLFGQLALADSLLAARETSAARALWTAIASGDDDEGTSAGPRIEALRRLADIERERSDAPAAEAYLRAAVRWIETTLSELASGDARLAFFGKRQGAYAELAVLLLDESDVAAAPEALDLLERSRMRQRDERRSVADRDEELREAREEVDFLAHECRDHALDASPDGVKQRRAREARSQLREAQDRLLDLDRAARARVGWSDEETDWSQGDSASSAASPTLPKLSAIDDEDQVLVYLEARERLVGVLLRPDARGRARVLRVETLDIGPLDVERALARLRVHVDKVRLGRSYMRQHGRTMRRGIERVLRHLGTALLQPFTEGPEPRLRLDSPLVVVPYGALHGVPFAALVVTGSPLVAHTDISVTRSLSQLTCESDRSLSNRRILSCTESAGDLPAIDQELNALGALAPGGQRRLPPPAFLEALRSTPNEAILHLPAHGSFEPEHPLFSGMRLGPHLLAVYDVAHLRLPGPLVLLSGCETGRHARAHGEELYGAEQAFLTAGARGVAGALWPIRDEASALWIARTAEALFEGGDARQAYSVALREAHAEGAPFQDWAGLIYAGEPRLRLPDTDA